jgi:hypothetical protein
VVRDDNRGVNETQLEPVAQCKEARAHTPNAHSTTHYTRKSRGSVECNRSGQAVHLHQVHTILVNPNKHRRVEVHLHKRNLFSNRRQQGIVMTVGSSKAMYTFSITHTRRLKQSRLHLLTGMMANKPVQSLTEWQPCTKPTHPEITRTKQCSTTLQS